MDAAQIEDAAARLAGLGLQPHQVERHIKGWRAAAAARAAQPRYRVPPVEEPPPPPLPPPPRPKLIPQLTTHELHELAQLLRHGVWRAGVQRPRCGLGEVWVGDAVRRVLGCPATPRVVSAAQDALVAAGMARLKRRGQPRCLYLVLTPATPAPAKPVRERLPAPPKVVRERLHVAPMAEIFATGGRSSEARGQGSPASA
jgi:hypothetical protein